MMTRVTDGRLGHNGASRADDLLPARHLRPADTRPPDARDVLGFSRIITNRTAQ